MKKTVAYITNPDKTDEQNLVSSFGFSPETADLEFAMTAEMGKNNVMEKGDNLAWHMIISYHPNDLTDPKLAHEVSTKIADSVLKGKYEYVLTTHTDKKHLQRMTAWETFFWMSETGCPEERKESKEHCQIFWILRSLIKPTCHSVKRIGRSHQSI